MKLLIITQSVDSENTTLGFFIDWINEFSRHFEKISVVCLYKGKHQINKNIKVISLGKENNISFFGKIWTFLKFIILKRSEYDSVFVHMNQEYILLSGFIWKILGKKIFFWRNHPVGNIFTDIAIYFSSMVFATSTDAYVAKSSKTKIMPVGISSIFKDYNKRSLDKIDILMLGRLSPIKKIEAGLEVVSRAVASGVDVRMTVVGDFLPKDRVYVSMLKGYVKSAKIEDFIFFKPGVLFKDTVDIYNNHHIFLNFTRSGSFDKTIIEALSCGCKVLTTNTSLKGYLPDISICKDDSESRFQCFKNLLLISKEDSDKYKKESNEIAKYHSLNNLISILSLCINPKK